MAKILVIDDDPDIALATRLILEGEGYTVIEAHSSQEGLAAVRQHVPDLIVLDVMMETPTAGFQTALTLRDPAPNAEFAAYRHIPIILLTAIHQTTPMRFSPDENYLPVDAFVEKPIIPVTFLRTVKALLAEKQVG
ncbi:MAG: response regulator [Chloroflexi bacterium CFX4]|nr:response regulator [Chloroflexi bacterium CFX4]MDL1921587.1 response regulator [Chloroflexi bacterium CFX3]